MFILFCSTLAASTSIYQHFWVEMIEICWDGLKPASSLGVADDD